ncbi:hypothetical protein AZE42_10378 [Rhizopogon vesiculosus]|uniref:Uncharacterized protein n=1 Tax=Rhizopogon vesiculosus TaxID=180088 RepID=A0A1J8QNU7_9AGAM|nr:hypothetical protein AZE42_10378 [Rhizopogon vesiculosus]
MRLLLFSHTSELIHNSVQYFDLHECSVEVNFQIIDLPGPGAYPASLAQRQNLGEVESITQMKPKGTSEHDDGLLEYLKDIIGTAALKAPIETALAEVDHNMPIRTPM